MPAVPEVLADEGVGPTFADRALSYEMASPSIMCPVQRIPTWVAWARRGEPVRAVEELFIQNGK